MTARYCPHLGQRNDPQTVLEFASNSHYCYRARPAGQVDLNHQWAFCLGSMHVDCPVYFGIEGRPLPSDIAYRKVRPARSKSPARPRLLVGVFAGLLVLALAAFLILPRFLNQPTAKAAAESPVAEVLPSSTPTPTATPSPTFTASPTATLLFTFTQAPSPTRQVCPLPIGWQEYVVKPTDSLLRLSVDYAVTIEMLQEANCLGTETEIHDGQRLYVPARPTSTPTFTPTPTATATRYIPRIVPTSTKGSGGGGTKPTAVPPTPIPPTPEPPTPEPPTEAPTAAP